VNRPHSRYVEGSHFRLIEERLARKWSTFDVAKKINVSRSTYTQVETGCRRGSEYIWDDLEKLFGVPKEELKT
jgi:transcriptional regulator with XRE-family HTH domain